MSTETRREFLKSLARTGALAGLTALAAVLFRRGRSAFACAPSNACAACAVSRVCTLRKESSNG